MPPFSGGLMQKQYESGLLLNHYVDLPREELFELLHK